MSVAPRGPVSEAEVVADASAIIALLAGEPFEHVDPEQIARAWVSAVNLSEVLAKLYEMGLPDPDADAAISLLGLRVAGFDEAQASAAARLKRNTRQAGLSLGDRACLALAQSLECPVITADRAWANVDVGVEVLLIR
jgi:PIN domain nuclease of toxin-antitoxin system